MGNKGDKSSAPKVDEVIFKILPETPFLVSGTAFEFFFLALVPDAICFLKFFLKLSWALF